ncbi:recombinase family protein [Streptomyces sp. NPDC091215]|uniref:recombinase family protein n=1 Tax=Streptomyces sp. NPDC091215 TaxID=3155192 RepID=UPI0034363750
MPYAPEYLHLVIPDVVFQAWLYGRNSDDATKTGDSVEDQLTTGRTLCHSFNWQILREFKDPDISASRHAKRVRGDFEDLIETIVNDPAPPGVRRLVVAYNAARYYRDLEAYVRLRNACLRANVLLCYNGQVYDLTRRDDRKATAQHAIDAEDEAEGLRDQNLRTATLQAEEGHPHGKMIYGYLREYAIVGGRKRCVKQYEDPQRGHYILKALQRADSGHSIGSIVRWLRSIPEAARPEGMPWGNRNVRSMLLNRAYLGERLHNGTYRKGSWDPIKGLESADGRAMFLRVTAKLTDPGRTSHRGTEVAHLLSFNGLCGECGDHALLTTYPHGAGSYTVLGCKELRNTGIREDVADAFVEEGVIGWFSRKDVARAALVPDNSEAAAKAEEAQRLVNGYEEQLREARRLAATFDPATGRPKLSVMALAEMEQSIEPHLAAERKKLEAPTGVPPLLMRLLTADDPDSVWNGRAPAGADPGAPGLSLEQKREVIRAVVTVRLFKASRMGIRELEPGRITLSFIGTPGFRARPLRVPASARAVAPLQGRVRGAASGTG